MTNKILDILGIGSGAICLTLEGFSDVITTILYILSLFLLLVSSSIGIFLKVKQITKDGKITDEELKELKDEIDELSNVVKPEDNNKKDDEK